MESRCAGGYLHTTETVELLLSDPTERVPPIGHTPCAPTKSGFGAFAGMAGTPNMKLGAFMPDRSGMTLRGGRGSIDLLRASIGHTPCAPTERVPPIGHTPCAPTKSGFGAFAGMTIGHDGAWPSNRAHAVCPYRPRESLSFFEGLLALKEFEEVTAGLRVSFVLANQHGRRSDKSVIDEGHRAKGIGRSLGLYGRLG